MPAPRRDTTQREAVELAFIAALQHLPARATSPVVIMREVLGFSAREVATTLETTVASVNSALQRARKTLKTRLPEQSQQATLRSLGDEQTRDLVERFIAAFVTGDVEAILALLTDDATFGMPPYPSWYRGARGDRRVVAHAERAAAPPAVRADPRERPAGPGLSIS